MGKMFDAATERRSLMSAWRRIRANGSNSASAETRAAVARFEQDESGQIFRIQKRLRDGSFEFDPQKGVLKKKSSGKRRGIVMASVQNRVVERALLERLQQDCEYVRKIIRNPFSVGGVPDRSVPHGLKLIEQHMADGKTQFVRSDISGFFDNIPRDVVLNSLSTHIADERFLQILGRATAVVLGNEKALGDDRSLFPVDDLGVAQGSPLSPLFGNILLSDFDKAMNDRGVVCVRFIDDFVILGDSARSVRKAFQNGARILSNLGLSCHDPFGLEPNKEKSEYGKVSSGFVFLGYQIEPGLYQPSRKARMKVLSTVDDCIRAGRSGINDCIRYESSFANRQRYVQTLDVIDRILKGWGNSFAYTNSKRTLEDVDHQIDERLDNFRKWYSARQASLDQRGKRRAGGVCLLSDVEAKSLNDVPFIVEGSGKKFRTSRKTLNVSTDGAVLSRGKRKGKDQGAGGWGFVVHETGQYVSGSEAQTTNNRMELMAVIETLRKLPRDRSLHIHTDSQYVMQGVNSDTPVRTNTDLWKEYEKLAKGRSAVKVSWVKGHAGNEFNEIADQLAAEAAKLLDFSVAQRA